MDDIIDYKEKYNEALESYNNEETCGSKDDRIRKALIDYFKHVRYNGIDLKTTNVEEVLSWLEKTQDKSALEYAKEQTSITSFKAKNWYVSKVDGKIYDMTYNPTDKIEPKFKQGQWIVWKDKCYKVNYNGCGYELIDQNGLITSLEYGTVDKNAHLWSIKDAKDGDVLTSYNCYVLFKEIDWLNIKCHCTYHYVNCEVFLTNTLHNKYAFRPATKEECAALFAKVREEKYVWDEDKKELKKAELKFNVGDWVVNKLGDAWHIDSFDWKNYQVSDGKGNYNYFPISKQDEMHLWTIQNAKVGDILVDIYGNILIYERSSTCTFFQSFCCVKEKVFMYSGGSHCVEGTQPATKEQRDTLMKAMTDAHYTFDFEKKELKKIEQKSAWSEEDEKMFRSLHNLIYVVPDYDCDSIRKNELSDWLKSLKERLQ